MCLSCQMIWSGHIDGKRSDKKVCWSDIFDGYKDTFQSFLYCVSRNVFAPAIPYLHHAFHTYQLWSNIFLILCYTIRRYINIEIINACFLILGDVDARHHRRNANRLDILPKGPHTFPIGKNSFFTCRAHVHNPGLVKDLKWFAPDGREIPQDDRYTNEILASACLTLLSNYANSYRIWKKIMIYPNYLRILHSSLPFKISGLAIVLYFIAICTHIA